MSTLPPFEEVVAEHGAVVWRVCCAVVGPVDADDAWSDAFLAALRAYPDLRPDSNVKGWLVTVAHNKAVDHLRRRGRAPIPTDATDRPEAVERTVARIDDPPDTHLWRALDALPPKQRSAVLYHHVAGLPYADVAPLLDCSAAAARRSAADGIARLRTSYRPEGTTHEL